MLCRSGGMDTLGSAMSCAVCAGYSSQNCPCCGVEAQKVTCPDCKGTGYGDWTVFDIIKRVDVKCNEAQYRRAALSEDGAADRGERYCRASCTCQTCQGEGEIFV